MKRTLLTLAVFLLASNLYANEWILVPAGTFQMGHISIAPPVHEVTLTNDFYLSKTEITNWEYLKVLQWAYDQGYLAIVNGTVQQYGRNLLPMNDGYQEIQFDTDSEEFYLRESPCSLAQDAYPDGYNPSVHPVNVSYYGAACYCYWLSEISGLIPFYMGDFTSSPTHNPYEAEGYRLSTEAEWEYAARYENGTWYYPWGSNTINCSYANYARCVTWSTAVGSYPDGASQLGFLDMSANVWEWTNDFASTYPSAPQIDPFGPTSGTQIECRGGSWNCWGQPYHTVWYRITQAASGSGCWTIGFRPAITLTQLTDTPPATYIDVPQRCYLIQNYPNPFNPGTTIEYGLNSPGHVEIVVLNIAGRTVAELFSDLQTAGYHTAQWHPEACPSGVYFVRINSEGFSDVRKINYLK